MKLTLKFRALKINKKKISEKTHKLVSATFREGIREFYRAAFASVPVDTGMARGSLIPLGRLIRNVPTSITPKRSRPKSKGYPDGKTLDAGIKRGQKSPRILIEGNRFEFSYNIRVFHWTINEEGRGWFALEKGRAAMKTYIKKANLAKKILKIFKDEIQGGEDNG